jgi:4-nitrophenyl phosphatase
MSVRPVEKINLFTACEAIVCDLDGTLYLEDGPIAGAQEFLQTVLRTGRQLYYFTNNTSISRQNWQAKLTALHFPVKNHQLITSADCADAYLKRNGLYPRIYLVGNRDLLQDFKERGFRCLSEAEALVHEPSAVVLGFDTELTYGKINTCYQLLLRNIPYIATHPDILCPVTKGVFKPDVGSFMALFETACGRKPIIVGKPTQEAVRFICEKAHLAVELIAFIGDRLYTDIRMAVESAMVGVLVLSGETTEELLLSSPWRPQLIAGSVAELSEHLR